jgi:ADP-ribose pyrophosphatase YjhB (NUDIX family)
VRDEQGQVLLVRSVAGAFGSSWWLPGGGVEHGEHPVAMHSVRLVYDAAVTGGSLLDEVAGSTDAAAWLTLAQAREVRLAPMLREVVLQLT